MESTGASAEVPEADASSPQSRVASHLQRARELQRGGAGDFDAATAELETAMEAARATPYRIEFQTRVELALALGELYVHAGEMEKARRLLKEEADFTERIFQIMQATGTPAQKRAAAGGRVQVRDRARQVALVGQPAPEIKIKDWLHGEPATLADLRGRVVLLEFWATWCKPCHDMFPKLKALDEQYRARGLEVIALTRHYFARREEAASETEELALMRSLIEKPGLDFRVGVATDEGTQDLYGATGMPTLALIDRAGIVRYAHFGGGQDERFNALLTACLDEEI
ncbi:MAG: TlpA family protein disulfide reductase [Acidobacteria bacterium]|nr:TlpA family protein disulfide reductase [Acidobacteriota bacterium]